jgi:CDP-diacylglycerol--glycerol-3-phosphate 3-phosphatidyltransferase
VPTAPGTKPVISANQVTAARLLLLPIGCYLLYQGTRGQWIALVSMTIVGCTDFVDGWLARKYGPTVLGGLMDPIADKVFIALTMLPALDLGWFPALPVTLIFFREFVITAARTAYSRRDVTLRTSYVAKIKTWYQMISTGLIFLTRIDYDAYVFVLTVCAIGPIVGGLIFLLVKRRVWRGSVAFAISFGAFRLLAALGDANTNQMVIIWSTVLITWASGGAYLFGIRDLPGTARFDAQDAVRLFGAASMPLLACPLIAVEGIPAWPVFATVALEFAIGGLDNLLAHQKRLGDWKPWGLRVLLQAGLLGGALAVVIGGGPAHTAHLLTLGALVVTVVAATADFWVHRRAYLESDELLRAA